MFKATRQRSVVKSITFRVLVVIADLIVIYILTKRIDTTIWLTVATNLTSTILYFIHERVWNNIKWGKRGEIKKDHLEL
jgi:uncharacterized membrane protein